MTRLVLAAVVLGLAPTAAATADSPSGTTGKQRGVSWVAGHEVGPGHFEPLVKNHVNWIVQTPFGWMRHHDSTEVALVSGGGVLWGETDAGLETTTRLARAAGIRTLLKPHIWLTRAEKGKWRTHIEMKNEAGWRAWFSSYRTFILHYARFAERHGIEVLCIGTELHATVVERPDDWRRLIGEIREVYGGKLTYAANWYREFEEVPFWDLLDYIGVQGYFPLSDGAHPRIAALREGWQPHREAIERIQRQYDKPVLFTEIGYKSRPYPARRPWEWPKRGSAGADAEDLQAQAVCYRAFFETFWELDWVAGAYFWKWFPAERSPAGSDNAGFTPQGKPAERVLGHWYGKSAD